MIIKALPKQFTEQLVLGCGWKCSWGSTKLSSSQERRWKRQCMAVAADFRLWQEPRFKHRTWACCAAVTLCHCPSPSTESLFLMNSTGNREACQTAVEQDSLLPDNSKRIIVYYCHGKAGPCWRQVQTTAWSDDANGSSQILNSAAHRADCLAVRADKSSSVWEWRHCHLSRTFESQNLLTQI